MTYWHYTCRHAAGPIAAGGLVLPTGRVVDPDKAPLLAAHAWMLDVCWFTDMAYPTRWQLGLTMDTIGCDRSEFRFQVSDDTALMPWVVWCRGRVPRADSLNLYADPRTIPGSWYVAVEPVPVVSA